MAKTPIRETFKEPCGKYKQILATSPTGGYKYRNLSPFEFKNYLIAEAKKSKGEANVLNAGRGNPNFFSTMPRLAFALLITICTKIGKDSRCSTDLGFMPPQLGIHERFQERLSRYIDEEEGIFLQKAYDKMWDIWQRAGLTPSLDAFTHNLVISAIGCFYPSPPRVQPFVEPVLLEYLEKLIYRSNTTLIGNATVMPTEGAAAAILYVFNSLKYNKLVKAKDRIGLLTPIFSPYLEIPGLENYNLEQVCVQANEEGDWEIPKTELEKLGDPDMKALFLVNPTNPTARSLSKSTIDDASAIILSRNPNLIILEDNVYAPFVREFNDFFNKLPKNTIGVFSFSKYFGVTGWRLGTIVMHDDNIIDEVLIPNTKHVNNRYRMLQPHPENIKFMDRILADSRQVAEAHVAGLGTPQQTLMTLFAVYDLLDEGQTYNATLKTLLSERMANLLEPIRYSIKESDLNTNYYVIIDIIKAAKQLTGNNDFGTYLENQDPLEFLLRLAKTYGTVLLPAAGFAGPFWGVRVSLANLPTKDYRIIGENLNKLINQYFGTFKMSKIKD
jgi:aspartate 4-decarboxylase